MCGIVGCVAKENCYGKLLSALEKLEYRGYDSAGIALLSAGGKIAVRKKKGAVANLFGAPVAGSAGIGHTRWATHGKPSDENAHPHVAGKFALVHNGIVENFAALKAELCAAGATFVSETDSEVIVKLIAHLYRGDFFGAVAAACARLEGAYAVAVLCEDFPDEIVCAKRRSPLIAGAGCGAAYVCSDVPALCGAAAFVCPVEDGEFVHIRGGEICFRRADGSAVPKVFCRLAEEEKGAERAAGSRMEAEIAEIPRGLSRTLGWLRACDFAPAARALRGAGRLFTVACGTAHHAALAFGNLLAREARIPVLCETASEFRYGDPLIGAGDVLVAVSQSGETADTLEAVRLARERGAYVIAVTNAEHSTLARLADLPLRTLAGAEVAVAATKSYNCQLLALYYLAAQTVFFKRAAFPAWFFALEGAAPACERAFGCFEQVADLAERLREKPAMYYIGRGTDRFTAAEGALKVREIAYLFAESCPAGELKHGTLALVEEGFPVFAVATARALAAKTANSLAEAKARGAFTALFSQEEFAGGADFSCRLPALPEALMPLVSVVPLQYFACRMCLLRGFDPDRPRNLAKSVTVE